MASLIKKLAKRRQGSRETTLLKEEEPGKVHWLAYREKYFAMIVKPEQPGTGILFSGIGEDRVLCYLKVPGGTVAPGELLTRKMAVYLGPVDYEILKSANLGLETIFDSGGLAPVRRLVMVVLRFFYRLVGNWGVAIILLTVVVKIILLPLTQKSFRSMKEMQSLQPQINSLRQVYKEDAQKMQKEIMELYRRHKVNPLGGCFPMLLQMPVFIALFTALRSAIELRQAPFFFWIHDLSVKDPYYVLPILMGGTMFFQQRLTPAADPQQARMAMMMPVVFTFLFMNFPSGLVLYWLVNSFLSLAEQWWIRREKN
jgi:YidC/Oxa1 family membrane protein insertase